MTIVRPRAESSDHLSAGGQMDISLPKDSGAPFAFGWMAKGIVADYARGLDVGQSDFRQGEAFAIHKAMPSHAEGIDGIELMNALAAPEWRRENFDALAGLQRLQPDWDNRGSTPPTDAAILLAEGLLSSLGDLEPHRILADPDGGVSIYLAGEQRTQDGGAPNRYVNFLFLNDGEILVTRADRDAGDSKIFEIESDGLVSEIVEARSFLN